MSVGVNRFGGPGAIGRSGESGGLEWERRRS